MRHRKPGPPSWLLIRRSLGAEPELKYYVSNADAETPLSTLALVACTRCRVEEFFEDCKSYLGMTQYETRSWVGWHHHMTLVGSGPPVRDAGTEAAQKNSPELTLDRTVRLLVAWQEPELRLARAIGAGGLPCEAERGRPESSHDKTWRAKHKASNSCGCRTIHIGYHGRTAWALRSARSLLLALVDCGRHDRYGEASARLNAPKPGSATYSRTNGSFPRRSG